MKENVVKKINDILFKEYGYDYEKMIETLREMLIVLRNFEEYDEHPEKYKGKCPKEI